MFEEIYDTLGHFVVVLTGNKIKINTYSKNVKQYFVPKTGTFSQKLKFHPLLKQDRPWSPYVPIYFSKQNCHSPMFITQTGETAVTQALSRDPRCNVCCNQNPRGAIRGPVLKNKNKNFLSRKGDVPPCRKG